MDRHEKEIAQLRVEVAKLGKMVEKLSEHLGLKVPAALKPSPPPNTRGPRKRGARTTYL